MKRKDILDILNTGFNHSVKDVLWGNILFTEGFKNLLKARNVEKLSRIKQVGPTYLIYPGAVHTRLNHSIGVYALSKRILISIAQKADEIPVTEVGMKSFLASALLHDIGHFPYAHSLKELAIREHEEIAATLIMENDELRNAVEDAGASPKMTAEIINTDIETDDEETLFYRGILSGTLDPDKLDYLSRDAFFAGVPYGTQSTDFIINAMHYVDGGIALEEDALVSVENVLFSKYLMYKTLYWHKGTRCATAMIKKALLTALEDGTISFDDLYLKDDDEFNELAAIHRQYRPFVLIGMVKHNDLLEKKLEYNLDRYPELTELCSHLDTRMEAERRLYSNIRRRYPQLEEIFVIFDIPEPIKFEHDMKILRNDGTVTGIREEESVFTKDVRRSFTNQLRKLSVFMPDYVAKEDVEKAIQEEFN